jgi:hypothetical protein
MPCRSLAAATLFVLAIGFPSAARADGFFTPYAGLSFDSKHGDVEIAKSFAYGASLMWLGTSGVGFEIDFAYHPKFFDPEDEQFFDFDSRGNVVSLMGNLVFGHEGGGLQPYLTGGFGLIRPSIESVGGLFDDISDNAFGVNAGGGIRVGGPKFGVRGDLRYFRTLSDLTPIPDFTLGNLHYWRGTVGVSIGF